MGEVFGYLHQLTAKCRSDSALASGLLRELLAARVDGKPLDDGQIAAELHTLLVTGSETVELFATGAALYQLDLHPEQKERAIAHPELDAVDLRRGSAFRSPHRQPVPCRQPGDADRR